MSTARKRSFTWVILVLILLVAAAVLHHVWLLSKLSVSTDNAQVDGDVISISAEVPGRIVEVDTNDNERVKEGQVLVKLDASDYQARLTQAEKALRSAQEREAAARAQLQLTQRQAQAAIGEESSGVDLAQSGVTTAASGVGAARQRLLQAQAATRAARANLARSRTSVDLALAEQRRIQDDLQRYRALYSKDEISRQQLEAIQTQSRQAQSRVEAARREVQASQAQVSQSLASEGQASEGIQVSLAQVGEAESRVGEAQSRLVSAQAAPDKIAVAAAQVKVIQAEIEQTRASIVLARKNLERTTIRAPHDGVVSKRSAQVGAFAQQGSPLLALVIQSSPWVTANFKETQMTRVRPGLKAEISVDSYPGRTFPGRVDSIQAGTGARFSLLPPENASGSYVKVVQRIPVKIVIEGEVPAETPLVPGMSVQARVFLP